MIDPLQRINSTPWTAPKAPLARAEKPLQIADPQESFSFQGLSTPTPPVYQAPSNDPVVVSPKAAAPPVPTVLSMLEDRSRDYPDYLG